jgi:hypothetical protein
MKKYTKRKPDIVEAIQFTGENEYEILREFCGSWGHFSFDVTREMQEDGRNIKTFIINSERAGFYKLLETDYLLKTARGELIAYDEDKFLEIYKEIE